MPHMRRYVPVLALYVGLFLGVVAACGASQREKAVRASVVAVNAARDGFEAWDAAHQKAIVDKATSREDGEAKLAAYRASRDPIVHGFEIAYRLLAVAATQTDDPSLRAALAAAASAVEAATKITGGP